VFVSVMLRTTARAVAGTIAPVTKPIAPDGFLVTGAIADTRGVWLIAGHDLYL